MERLDEHDALELLRASMYWVSQMENDLRNACSGNYVNFVNKSQKKPTYKEDVLKAFGALAVNDIKALGSLTMVELADRCDAWHTAVVIWMDNEEHPVNGELEDVMFWSGEILQTIENVRQLLVIMGWTESGEIDRMINKLGAEFVGTKLV